MAAPATVAPATVAPATVAPATVASEAPATVAPATVASATVASAAPGNADKVDAAREAAENARKAENAREAAEKTAKEAKEAKIKEALTNCALPEDVAKIEPNQIKKIEVPVNDCVTTYLLMGIKDRPDLMAAFTKDQLSQVELTTAEVLRSGIDVRRFERLDPEDHNGLAILQRRLEQMPNGIRVLGDGYAQLAKSSGSEKGEGSFGVGLELEVPWECCHRWSSLTQLIIRKGSQPGSLETRRLRGGSLLSPQTQDTSFSADFKALRSVAGFQLSLGARLDAALVDWAIAGPDGEQTRTAVTTLAFVPAVGGRWFYSGNDNKVDIRAQVGLSIRGYSPDADEKRQLGAEFARLGLGADREVFFGVEPRLTLRINAVEVGMMLPWHPQEGAAGISGLHFVPFISLQPGAQLVTF